MAEKKSREEEEKRRRGSEKRRRKKEEPASYTARRGPPATAVRSSGSPAVGHLGREKPKKNLWNLTEHPSVIFGDHLSRWGGGGEEQKRNHEKGS